MYYQDFDSSIFDMIIKIRPQNLFSVKQTDGNISVKRTGENYKFYGKVVFNLEIKIGGKGGVGGGSKVV